MTVAINEILKQVEVLSPTEQVELAAKLSEQVRQNAEAVPRNGRRSELPTGEPPLSGAAADAPSAEAAEEDWLDVFSLNHVPPKRVYLARARFHYVGRGKPMPYELDADLLENPE